MERRDLVMGAGALVAGLQARSAAADDMQGDHSSMHEHHHAMGPANAALLAAAADCVRAGQVCIDHCLQLFTAGDNSTAACARKVTDLIPVCQALQALAASNSRYLPRYAHLAMELCKDCEDECRKHEREHVACKNCADACAACGRECQKVAA